MNSALGVVADSINFLIEELALLVIRVQMVTTEEIAASNQMLSTLAQQLQTFDAIAKILETADATTRENLVTPLLNMYKAMRALKEDIERTNDLSNQLYASVSQYQLLPVSHYLPPEESHYHTEQ